MQSISGMDAAALPMSPDIWDILPADGRALMLAFQAQVVAFQAEVAALQTQRRELGRHGSDRIPPIPPALLRRTLRTR
jgi:hypothetical protein